MLLGLVWCGVVGIDRQVITAFCSVLFSVNIHHFSSFLVFHVTEDILLF